MSRAFRLAGLLRLRRLEEERAAAALATANAETRAAATEREELVALMSGTTFAPHADENQWRAMVAARSSINGLVGEASVALAVAERRGVLATEDWSAARSRLAMVDKLAARHAAMVAAEEEKAEQLVLDEAAARRRAQLPTQEDR